MDIRLGTHFHPIKIAKLEVGVIYHLIYPALLFLYMVLIQQESGFQLPSKSFVKA